MIIFIYEILNNISIKILKNFNKFLFYIYFIIIYIGKDFKNVKNNVFNILMQILS